MTYWGVADARAALEGPTEAGAAPRAEVRDAGDGTRVASATGPHDPAIGIIENPHFAGGPGDSPGPGRGPAGDGRGRS